MAVKCVRTLLKLLNLSIQQLQSCDSVSIRAESRNTHWPKGRNKAHDKDWVIVQKVARQAQQWAASEVDCLAEVYASPKRQQFQYSRLQLDAQRKMSEPNLFNFHTNPRYWVMDLFFLRVTRRSHSHTAIRKVCQLKVPQSILQI